MAEVASKQAVVAGVTPQTFNKALVDRELRWLYSARQPDAVLHTHTEELRPLSLRHLLKDRAWSLKDD